MAGYPPRGPFDNLRTGAQGMFGGLSRGFQGGATALNPYSNRLLAFSAGMLGGGPSDAMKGLIAGGVLDRESADRKKLNEALAALGSEDSGLIPNSPALRGLMAADTGFAKDVILEGLKPADYGDKYQGYQLAKAEGYTGSWMDYQKEFKGDSGLNISLNQVPADMGARIGLGDQFLDELNVSMAGGASIRDRIATTFGGDATSQAKARSQLAMGMGEPAAIWRRVESGKEALVRQLTGAGMAVAEAQQQAARYSIGATDSVETMISKMDGLERDLTAVREGALNARRGTLGEGDEAGEVGKLTPNEDGTLTWSP